MALLSWWQITTPHKDIREGKLSEAIFAADLGDVYIGKAPLEYQDATLFFQKTYLTQGLKNLLENVLSRLNGGKGDPVIQLQTPFGGGKTHALLTLYHVIKNRKEIAHLPIDSELPKIKNAKVAVFVGTHADAVSGKTLWGEIAFQLGQYEVVKDHDKKRIAPGKEKFRQVLDASGPTLILLDELLEYIVKANRTEKIEKITHGQTLAFLQELTELVASTDRCSMVITLPASILEQYDEEAEKSLQQIQKISGRVETIYTPVEGVELYEVIRTRLFENFGDDRTRKDVAQWYFSLYQGLGTDVPPEVRELGYRDRIQRAYPFHPELIDALYERWGSYPTFQRTRGVLRLLAEVVADLYKKKTVSPLIQSSLVDLHNQTIRREFIKHIGNEYDSVISADIAGEQAKAPEIDKEMGSEYEKYGIAKGIATSVFINSFSAGVSKETTLSRIRVALLREEIPVTIVGDAVSKLEEKLWYFHSERKQYAFRNQPNLNRVIVDREETILESKILEELKARAQKISGGKLEIYLWPNGASDIPDNKNLKLAILAPEYIHDSEKTKKLTSELFERAGSSFRVYKNTLFVLAMDGNQYLTLIKSLKRFLALEEIQGDSNIMTALNKESHQELKKKLNDAEREIPFIILTAYRHLAVLEEKGVDWKDIGIPTVGTNVTISERVKNYLLAYEKILPKISPKYIIDKTFAKEENEKELREIYELSLKTPGMPLFEDENVLINTVKDGVRSGYIGVREGTEIYHIAEVSPTMDSIVLRSEVAKEIKQKEVEGKAKKEEDRPGIDKKDNEKDKKDIKKEGGAVRKLTLRAKIPCDKLSYIVSGVIIPLNDKGLPPEITIEIRAEAKEYFDRATLDTKVKETLQQIDAEIEDWKEE